MLNEIVKWIDEHCDDGSIFSPKGVDQKYVENFLFGNDSPGFLLYIIPTIGWCAFAALFFRSWTVLILSVVVRVSLWCLFGGKFNILKYIVPTHGVLGIIFFSSVLSRWMDSTDGIIALTVLISVAVLFCNYSYLVFSKCWIKKD